MPRRRPFDIQQEPTPIAPVPIRPGRGNLPEHEGDRIRPWTASGGLPFWLFQEFIDQGQPDPAFAGVQFLASVYVADGLTGFLKSIKVGPYKPSILNNSDALQWVIEPLADLEHTRPDGDHGFWTTPMGWEAYQSDTEPPVIPFWQWHLRFLPGTVERIKGSLNIPPFSFADPNSWFLVPNIPVPLSGYPQGIPGSAPGEPWPAQRMQRIGAWEEGEVHIIVPGDTTVALFAEWRQLKWETVFFKLTDAGTVVDTITVGEQGSVFPLGPSFGQLIGYSQPQLSEVTVEAARKGWQS